MALRRGRTMRWDERQAAMLAEMGIRLWAPQGAAGPAAEAMGQQAATAEAAALSAAVPAPAPAGAPTSTSLPRPAPLRAPAMPAQPGLERGTAAGPPPRVAELDWPALREAVAACTACKLCEGRRQTVFGVGSERAHWMVVGEAPGEHEDQQGEPFVGKSGQLLDNMLAAIGLTRGEAEPARQVYIANAIKCRPPGNRNPEPLELATCEPFLARQVQLVQPKIILAMGSFAVRSLLRSTEPVGKLRGRVHHFEGVPLVVTYHPAYLLRNLQEKARAWDDLCLAMETANALASATSA
jgi:uracil-DNA glycosylase